MIAHPPLAHGQGGGGVGNIPSRVYRFIMYLIKTYPRCTLSTKSTSQQRKKNTGGGGLSPLKDIILPIPPGCAQILSALGSHCPLPVQTASCFIDFRIFTQSCSMLDIQAYIRQCCSFKSTCVGKNIAMWRQGRRETVHCMIMANLDAKKCNHNMYNYYD